MPVANKPINVLFVLPSFDTGGSEKLVVDIIKHLAPSRFTPVLAVFFSGQREDAFRALGVPFYVVHNDRIRSKWEIAMFLQDIVRKHRIDVVNTHHPNPLIQGFVPFRLLSHVKWVHTEHTRLDLEAGIPKRAVIASQLLLRSVDLCVGISQGVCQYFQAELGVPERRIRKILNGVDVERFELDGFDRVSYKKALVAEADTLLIGMFANFRPQKNHANLIRAIDILRNKSNVKFQLLLCGEGETFQECKTLIERLGVEPYVQMLGARFDIPQLMNTVDIYCLPSRFEGLPLSLLEAMACRRAIVATNVVGNDEVIVDGINGLFCANDDPVDLAEKLARLLTDEALRTLLGTNAYETACHLSYQSMMRSYEELFTEVCRTPTT